jgi:quercetin dioxygenase-like cupin family protein
MNKRPKLIFGSSRAARFARYVLAMFAYILLAVSVVHAQDPKDNPQKSGVVATDLIVRAVEGVANQEFTVIDVKYAPGGVNRRHFHPAAVTFFIVSGTPVFQEEGKEPITLKPGDSLLVPAGTTHSHWNPSKAEGVRWLEFIVAEKGKGRSIRKP